MARPGDDGKIRCTGCERRLPGDVEHFHRHRDAFKPRCKECRGSSFGVKSPNKVYDAKEGHKFCSSCNTELPANDDYFFNGGKDKNGLTSQCKKCQSESDYGTSRPNRGRKDGKWECTGCGRVLERTEENFYTSGDSERPGRANDGLMVTCKACHTQRSNQQRREAENGVENSLTQEQWVAIKEKFNASCAYCGNSGKLERDHVEPLSKGGDTVAQNIVPACQTCNRSKAYKHAWDWWAEQSHYSQERAEKLAKHINGN